MAWAGLKLRSVCFYQCQKKRAAGGGLRNTLVLPRVPRRGFWPWVCVRRRLLRPRLFYPTRFNRPFYPTPFIAGNRVEITPQKGGNTRSGSVKFVDFPDRGIFISFHQHAFKSGCTKTSAGQRGRNSFGYPRLNLRTTFRYGADIAKETRFIVPVAFG